MLSSSVADLVDGIRLVGNDAVHDENSVALKGFIDPEDSEADSNYLFRMMNELTESCIARPRRLAELHAPVEPGRVQGIQDRDEHYAQRWRTDSEE